MKKYLMIFITALTLTLTLALTGCTNSASISYEKNILDEAKARTKVLEFDKRADNPFINNSRTFSVTKTSQNEFFVDVNGTEMIIQTPEKTKKSIEPENVERMPEKYNVLIKNSKDLVRNYINASEVLKNKKEIVNYIDELQIKLADLSEDAGAIFLEDYIFVNRLYLEDISEWMLVHEMIHAISYVTHNYKMEYEYSYNLFNEVITDIIACFLKPSLSAHNEIISGYMQYYDLLYPYINLMGDKSLEAYFYSYEEVINKISKDELEFFVLVLENLGSENADVYYNNLVLKWYAA